MGINQKGKLLVMEKDMNLAAFKRFHLPKPQLDYVTAFFLSVTNDERSANFIALEIIAIARKEENRPDLINKYIKDLSSLLKENHFSFESLKEEDVLAMCSLNGYFGNCGYVYLQRHDKI